MAWRAGPCPSEPLRVTPRCRNGSVRAGRPLSDAGKTRKRSGRRLLDQRGSPRANLTAVCPLAPRSRCVPHGQAATRMLVADRRALTMRQCGQVRHGSEQENLDRESCGGPRRIAA